MNDAILPTHILLAEDDDDDCVLFHDVLEELSSVVRLTIAHNGEHLMTMLQKPENKPDLIFLDLNMPRKNGFECLEEIKQDERLKEMPVIILSTSSQPSAIEHVYRHGASLYVPKPSDFAKLKKAIKHVLCMNWKKKNGRPTKE